MGRVVAGGGGGGRATSPNHCTPALPPHHTRARRVIYSTGEIKMVPYGFWRNYLLPRREADLVSEGVLKWVLVVVWLMVVWLGRAGVKQQGEQAGGQQNQQQQGGGGQGSPHCQQSTCLRCTSVAASKPHDPRAHAHNVQDNPDGQGGRDSQRDGGERSGQALPCLRLL